MIASSFLRHNLATTREDGLMHFNIERLGYPMQLGDAAWNGLAGALLQIWAREG